MDHRIGRRHIVPPRLPQGTLPQAEACPDPNARGRNDTTQTQHSKDMVRAITTTLVRIQQAGRITHKGTWLKGGNFNLNEPLIQSRLEAHEDSIDDEQADRVLDFDEKQSNKTVLRLPLPSRTSISEHHVSFFFLLA